jgi:hypothetical protein
MHLGWTLSISDVRLEGASTWLGFMTSGCVGIRGFETPRSATSVPVRWVLETGCADER